MIIFLEEITIQISREIPFPWFSTFSLVVQAGRFGEPQNFSSSSLQRHLPHHGLASQGTLKGHQFSLTSPVLQLDLAPNGKSCKIHLAVD